MPESHKPDAREAWDLVLRALAHAINTDPDIITNPARSAMTGDQAKTLFGVMGGMTPNLGELMVIRTKQGDKSQLSKLRSVK